MDTAFTIAHAAIEPQGLAIANKQFQAPTPEHF
ncbi:hypothetical protein SVI_1622 [Shewanella violacea DSS12]|uniref:Uncharacterized protein n=1 Tax=Shewanella violacea (strain JCM 10179 / CIP 106290 / LMG 19151 / DSS12) TaxID=637905 RepID=D4ZIU4_SHEVD|nr:hypothetical protein SVI_1622 [Shewanella violacea DSS12]